MSWAALPSKLNMPWALELLCTEPGPDSPLTKSWHEGDAQHQTLVVNPLNVLGYISHKARADCLGKFVMVFKWLSSHSGGMLHKCATSPKAVGWKGWPCDRGLFLQS